jgi:hypothetical protein
MNRSILRDHPVVETIAQVVCAEQESRRHAQHHEREGRFAIAKETIRFGQSLDSARCVAGKERVFTLM